VAYVGWAKKIAWAHCYEIKWAENISIKKLNGLKTTKQVGFFSWPAISLPITWALTWSCHVSAMSAAYMA